MLKDMIEDLNLDDGIEELTPKQMLKGTILALIHKGRYEDKTELRAFLKAILPHNNKKYFMYVADEEGTFVNLSFNYYDYIEALCIMSQYHYTLYFHPTSFKGWTQDKNVTSFRCTYIDIDDVAFDFDIEMATKEQVVNFIINTYNVPYELIGDIISISGHGLHICHFISETDNIEMRQKYIDSLLTVFKGDKMTRNPGKKFRVPTSYNIKDPNKPIKSRMFIINESPNRNIHRLDPLLKTEEEIQEYFTEYNVNLRAKKNATRAKNQTINDASPPQDIGTLPNSESSDLTAGVPQKEKKKTSDEYEPIDCNKLTYHHNFSDFNSRWNIIYDLNNYIIRNGPMCLTGKRNTFFHILTNYCRLVMTQDETIEFCKQYYDEENSFYNEMIRIIKATYKRKSIYRYRYETIAAMLDFSPIDIAQSKSNFSEERKKAAERERNRRKYLKYKANHKSEYQLRKEFNINYINEHPDKPIKEIMIELGISQATAYRLKKNIA